MSNLRFRTKFGYGLGHVLNDLCSAMWFTYLLLYFHHVLLFPNTLAGVVLLLGQVADAVSTPFVGHEADRTDDLPICVNYGRRKTWHFIGTVCVISTFPFIFFGCLVCETAHYWAQVFYFTPFVVVFQFGWAATQISHLALLPNLSSDPHDRTELIAIRYAFTVLATITVYCITWLVIGLSMSSPQSTLGPTDKYQFVSVVLIVVGIGAVFTVGFHILIKEDNTPSMLTTVEDEERVASFTPMVWKEWFYEPQFYQVAVLYMATRLFCNLSQAYIPLYLEDTLILDEESIAYIPLVIYISGLITAFAMKPVNKLAGRKVTFLIGCLLGLCGSLWVYFGSGKLFCRYFLYVVAVLLGSGASTMLVTSLSITADLIGLNVECGAFVYGLLSFTDKLSNGLAVMLIQYLTPCMIECTACRNYFRYVIGFACGGAAILGIISILTLLPVRIGERKPKGSSIDKVSHVDCGEIQSEEAEGYASVSQSDDDEPLILRSGTRNICNT